MPPSSRKIPSPQRIVWIICLALLLLGALYLAIQFISSSSKKPAAINEETQQTGQQAVSPPQEITALPAEQGSADHQPAKEEEETTEPDLTRCPALGKELSSFFNYLDEQSYIQEFQFKNGMLPHFREILEKLIKTPPVVTVADNDLFEKLKNMAHFYRVLGAKDIFLAKSYLSNEEGRLEHDLGVFYQWLLLDSCKKQGEIELSLPLPPLYEYAAFFLTSAGGKSYLFRRTEHTGLIVEYYCILVVDLANRSGLNRYGIDLAPLIDSCFSHMQQNTSLLNRSVYLQNLQSLRLKYGGD